MEKFFITEKVMHEILQTVGTLPCETGGILGASDKTICEFAFDVHSSNSPISYVPNTSYLNTIVETWLRRDIFFCGIVHSHSYGFRSLSEQDINYAKNIISVNKNHMSSLLFPIVIHYEGGSGFEFIPYMIDIFGNVVLRDYEIIL